MGKALAITFGLLISVFIFIIYRTGYMKPVDISSGEQGPFVFIYKTHKGPYHEIAPVIDSVEKFFKDSGLPCPLTFGRYLNDPELTPHDRLVSHGGCAFPTPNPKLEEIIAKGEFERQDIEKLEYVVAHFEGSPSIGPLKVYPQVKAWLAKYGYKIDGPVIEIYQTTGPDSLHTRYLFPYR